MECRLDQDTGNGLFAARFETNFFGNINVEGGVNQESVSAQDEEGPFIGVKACAGIDPREGELEEGEYNPRTLLVSELNCPDIEEFGEIDNQIPAWFRGYKKLLTKSLS